jgi:peptidoglycan/LPS O-acetylase OafA/YrhL
LVLFLCYVYCITSGDLGNVGNIRNLHGFDRFAQIFMNITTLGLDLVPSLGGYTFQLIGPAWSLGSELLFYLLAPWLVRMTWWRTTALVLVVFAIRLVLFKAGYDRYPFRVLFFPFSIGFFMLGHLGYLVLSRIESMPFFRSDTLRRWVSVLSVAGILGSGAVLEVGHGIDPDTPNLWTFYLIVAFLLPTTFMGSRNSAIDRFLGNLSFPLYISHYLVLTFVSDYVAGSQNARRIIALGLAILFALLLTVAIELPIEKARAKVNAWVMKNRWPRLFWQDARSNQISIEIDQAPQSKKPV